MNENIKTALAKHTKELRKISDDIHDNPELGMEEYKAAEWQVKLLKKWKWKIETPYAGMKTAYKATFGKGKPVFCFMSEYDALPQLGHGCGHNLICASALGAGQSLASVMQKEKIPGSVVIMGTPGEEGMGGKVNIVKRTKMKGIDAAMMSHPGVRTTPDTGGLAICRYDVEYYGKSSHAAASPENGINALDAVMLLFHGVNAWREHLPESCRIHGVVTNGGTKPNIVPDFASCSFYLRSADDKVHNFMQKRFKDIAKGAALMTGAKHKAVKLETDYRARNPNKPMNEEFLALAVEVGLNPIVPERPGRGSTDFGDVSQVIPGIHIFYGASEKGGALHSPDFVKAAGSDYGFRQTMRTAEAMANVGYRFFTDKDFRNEVFKDFKRKGK